MTSNTVKVKVQFPSYDERHKYFRDCVGMVLCDHNDKLQGTITDQYIEECKVYGVINGAWEVEITGCVDVWWGPPYGSHLRLPAY